jgi:hypothetical protein
MKIDCFKPTLERWYSEFKIASDARHQNRSFVHVSFIGPMSNGFYRCCVWGNDDYGFEFDHQNKEYVLSMYVTVCQMENVASDVLATLGFVRA